MSTQRRPHRSSDFRRLRPVVIARDGGCCCRCGASGVLAVHHVRPRSIGGSNRQTNLITVCEPCHRTIHTHTQQLAACLMWLYGALVLHPWVRQIGARR